MRKEVRERDQTHRELNFKTSHHHRIFTTSGSKDPLCLSTLKLVQDYPQMYISRSVASKLCVCLCNITCIYTWYLNAVLFGSHSCLVLKLYSNCLKCTCCMFSARLLAWCPALQAEIYLYCAFSPSLPNPSPLLSATPSSPASSSSLSRLALSLSRWFLPP